MQYRARSRPTSSNNADEEQLDPSNDHPSRGALSGALNSLTLPLASDIGSFGLESLIFPFKDAPTSL